MNVEKEIFDIALQDIMPNRFQPREIFNDDALGELAQSIKEHGVIQPIIVRKVGDKFEIIAGERRFRASKLAGKETIPALIKNIDDKETAKIALLENLQRQNLTPIEEAKTYQTILKLENVTQEELATSLGKSQSAIANKIRLLNLDESVQTALLNSKISERHARSLLNIEDKNKQRELLNRIVLERMTVKQLDDEISRMLGRTINTFAQDNQLNDMLQKEEPSQINIDASYQVLNDTTTPVFGLPPIMKQTTAEAPLLVSEEPVFKSVLNDEISQEPVIQTQDNINNNQSFNPFENMNTSNINIYSKPTDTEEVMQNNQPEVFQTPIVEEPILNNQIPSEPVVNTNFSNSERPVIEEPKPVMNNIFEQYRTVAEPPMEQEENHPIYDLNSAIGTIKESIKNIENRGFSINTEEFDFENVYQIVIKIDKNK